jgi:hypothetical protein
MSMTKPLLAAIAALAAVGSAVAETSVSYETYIEAYRPGVEPQPLSPPEAAELKRALSAWNRNKTEANLALIRPYADKGDTSAMRAMMLGYLHLRQNIKDRGASAALAKPEQGLAPLSGLWAMALWRRGVRDRDVARTLDLCLGGTHSSREGPTINAVDRIVTVSSMSNDLDCGFETEGNIFEIMRLLDYARKNNGRRKDIPTVSFIERPVADQAANDARRLASIMFRLELGYESSVTPADREWLQARIAADPIAKADHDEYLFKRDLANIRYRGAKPAADSWIWAYMDADPKRRELYNQTLNLQSWDYHADREKFNAAIATGKPEDRDWLGIIAMREKGAYLSAWWDRYGVGMADESSAALSRWCNAGAAEACRRAFDARNLEEARRSSGVASGGSSYAPPDLAVELKAFRDREAAINTANCARASLGASITCNR